MATTRYAITVSGPGGEATGTCDVEAYGRDDVRGTWRAPQHVYELSSHHVTHLSVHPVNGTQVLFDSDANGATVEYGADGILTLNTPYYVARYKVGQDGTLWEHYRETGGPLINPGTQGGLNNLPPGGGSDLVTLDWHSLSYAKPTP